MSGVSSESDLTMVADDCGAFRRRALDVRLFLYHHVSASNMRLHVSRFQKINTLHKLQLYIHLRPRYIFAKPQPQFLPPKISNSRSSYSGCTSLPSGSKLPIYQVRSRPSNSLSANPFPKNANRFPPSSQYSISKSS